MSLEMSRSVTDGTPADVIERYASLPQRAQASDFGTYDENIVVVDTETTGVSVKKDELTQIAAARLEHGEVTEWYVTFVNPGIPIPDEISHLTHIYDADVADAPSPQEALAGLVAFAGDAKMVAHNAEFDRNFTTKYPAGYPLLENTWIDSLELSRIALPRMKSHRLIDLVRAFGAPISTHRADDDVAALCAVYRVLLAAVDAMPEGLLHSISQLATPQEWTTQPLFAAFADRAYERRLAELIEGGMDPAEAKALAPERFSLKQIRRDRMADTPRRAKVDAADMVSAEVLQQANVRVEREGEGMPMLTFPTPEAVEEVFTPEGLIGTLYEDYETREEQAEMALAVRDAFASSVNLCVEAGTGVGKSMAYLVPAAFTAQQNNISLGVATKTNALLDQLVYKELPLLSKALGDTLTYASLKGFSHYPCLRKIQRLMESGAQMRMVMNEEKTQAPAIAGVLSFIEQTGCDDMDTLKVDFRTLPRSAISTTSHECLRRKCPFYGQSCFVFGARKLAESADIVVTNQSLFFCDVAAEGGLLPPIRYWVVDEAHGAEAEARQALALEISLEALGNLVSRVGADANARNVFVRAERTVDVTEVAKSAKVDGGVDGELVLGDPSSPGTLFFALTNKAKTAGRAFAETEAAFLLRVHDLLQFDPNKKSSYDMTDIWINDQVRSMTSFGEIVAAAKDLIDVSEALIRACQELVGYLDEVEHAAVIQREIAAVALELKDLVRALDVIFVNPTDAYVCSAYLNKRPDKGRGMKNDVIRASLYNVGAMLDETLFARTRSVVFTSATLTVNGSFEPFEHALGLNSSEQSRANTLTLESSYDFDRNMRVLVVNDMAEPNSPKYLEQLKELLVDVHRANNGSLLTLFTNKKEMEACFAEVSPRLKEDELRLVCQRWGVSVKNLRDDFLTDETLSLFALKSFWEGFDAPGKTLKGVIIPKLPFIKPTDPLSCERAARDDAAWRHFVLPQAVLEVRQAAGRLIRRADDSGVLILADSRLVSKSYGKVFLRSLPSKNVRFVSTEELLDELRG